MADQTQIIPENSSKDDNTNRRRVVKKTTAPTGLSIKNPIPIKVEMRDKDGRQFGLDEANKLVAKFKQQLSISPVEVPQLGGGIQQLTDYIKKLDPQNTSGAVKPALDIMDKLLKQGTQNHMGSIPGIMGSDLMNKLQQFMDILNKNNDKQNNQQQQPQCPIGMVWDANVNACVIDNRNPLVSQSSDFLTSWT